MTIAENVSIINHYFSIFKLHVYKSCKKHLLNLHKIITNVCTVNTLQKTKASLSDRKSKIYYKKWNCTENKLPVSELKNRDNIRCFLKEERWWLCLGVIFLFVVS